MTIIGASVRAAAQSALRAGYAPIAADLFADADLARICRATRVDDYPAGFRQILSGDQPGGWLYTGGLENYPRFVARWSRIRPLWGNGARQLLSARDPRRLAAALTAAGLPGPAIAARRADLDRQRRWLEKRLTSTGGSGVGFADTPSGREMPDAPGVFYQEYLAGEPCAAVFVACRGRSRLLGVTRQLIGVNWLRAGGFRYCGSIGPLPLSPAARERFQEIGQVLAAQFDLVGLFGVDVVLGGGVAWPVEINPRYAASLEVLERAEGWSAIGHHMNACRDGILPSDDASLERSAASGPIGPSNRYPPSATFGKAILFSRRPLVASAEMSGAWLERASGESPELADVPRPHARIDAGDPIATLLASGADVDDTLARLRRRAEELEAELWPAGA